MPSLMLSLRISRRASGSFFSPSPFFLFHPLLLTFLLLLLLALMRSLRRLFDSPITKVLIGGGSAGCVGVQTNIDFIKKKYDSCFSSPSASRLLSSLLISSRLHSHLLLLFSLYDSRFVPSICVSKPASIFLLMYSSSFSISISSLPSFLLFLICVVDIFPSRM